LIPSEARPLLPNESLLTVLDFNLTITGAKAGNGTFGLSDFSGFLWEVNLPLDLNSDLIGQLNSESDFDFAYGPVIGSGAPVSISYLTIRTNEDDIFTGSDDILTLVSMAPIPIPSVAWLFGTGLIGLYLNQKKKLTCNHSVS
jgi:hypothetical protein